MADITNSESAPEGSDRTETSAADAVAAPSEPVAAAEGTVPEPVTPVAEPAGAVAAAGEARVSSSAATVEAALAALEGRSGRGRLARLMVFMGPAFIASVAYVDPGNVATNISAGARYGYMLLWVIVASNLMAMVIQGLSAKLGIATGKNLAEMCREQYPRWVTWGMWGLMELVAMATDLAEFLGAAVGMNLLFGIPLFTSGLITAVVTFLILMLERHGFRPMELVISAMVGAMAVCYLVETILDRPDWGLVLGHAVVPRFDGSESIVLATGILGATVMPHAIFLHSSLTQGRIVVREPTLMKRLFKMETIDVVVAMTVAGMINASMLIMAASTFHRGGMTGVGTIEEAYKTLVPLLGGGAAVVFGVSLLVSGLSSSTVGTMAGQVMMQGFLRRRIAVWVRRVATVVPSLIVIGAGADPTKALVLSQVFLSLGLPFAVIPLVMFTRRRDLMGPLTNRGGTTLLAWVMSGLIIALNVYLIYDTLA